MLLWRMILTHGDDWLGKKFLRFCGKDELVCALANCRSLPVLNHSDQGAALLGGTYACSRGRCRASSQVRTVPSERQIARLEGCRMAESTMEAAGETVQPSAKILGDS